MRDDANDIGHPEPTSVLACLNERRFELLLYAAQLGTFTVAELRRVVPVTHSASIARDVVALETHGLLFGDPPAGASTRQGYTVTYTLPPYVPELFAELAAAVKDAWPTGLPSDLP